MVDDAEVAMTELEMPLDLIDTVREDEIRSFEAAAYEQRKRLEQVRATATTTAPSDLSDGEKRMQYLMHQSDVFAHFISGVSHDEIGGVDSTKKKSKARARMSEDAEDKQLLKAAQSKTAVTRLLNQPGNVTGLMRPYQLEGLNWLIKLHDNHINGILADEMGLGKTLQSISLLAYLKESRNISGPHCVIVPKSTVSNWLREFAKWCPSLRAIRLQGDKAERARVCKDEMILGKFDVVVCSNESVLLESRHILRLKWKYVIIDEAHRIKNENSSLSKAVRLIKSDFRLLITGTPLQNNLHELWALLNFLLPDVFNDAESFDSWFNVDDSAAKENVIKRLHTVLRPFLLRRVKCDVEKDIPPKREIKLYVGLSAMQRDWYTKIISKDPEALNGQGGDRVRLLNVLMQLRKVCNHPYLFEGAEAGPPWTDGPHLWENAGKFSLLHKLLPKLVKQGSRVLIFSQMTRVLDILEDYMLSQQYQYCRIDGSTTGELRDEATDEFNRPGSPKFCFLLSTRAGGLGINLQTADTVILYDSDWNPQVDLQAMDRAHRIGQTKEVKVFRLITEGTVEEKVVERADRKLFLDAAVIQQGRMSEKYSQLSKGELMTMVRFGADEIIKNQHGTLTNEDIDIILARSEERTAAANLLISTQMQHNLANFTVQLEEGAAFNIFSFEGETFEKKGKKPVLPFLELLPSVREARQKVDEKPQRTNSQKGKPKTDAFPEWQFYDKSIQRIQEIEAELLAQQKSQVALAKRLKTEASRLKKSAKGSNRKTISASSMEGIDQARGEDRDGDEEKVEEEGDDDDDDDDEDDDEDDEGEDDEGEDDTVEGARASSNNGSDLLCTSRRLLLEIRQGKFDLPPDIARERQEIIDAAFTSWSKRDFRAVIDALERNGRTSKDITVKEVAEETGKVESEVEEYVAVFMERWQELSNWKDIHQRTEKGEKRMQRDRQIRSLCQRKVASRTPINYSYSGCENSQTRFYSDEEDLFLVYQLQRHGWSQWDDIRAEIRKNDVFRFDWFFKSRTAKDLASRAELLVRLIEKEFADAGKDDLSEPRKRQKV